MACGGCSKKRGVSKLATAAKGLVTITAAELRRDRAPLDVVRERMAICAACETSQWAGGRLWCGEPMVETDTSCGCDCLLKARIASQECPQKKWVAVTVTR